MYPSLPMRSPHQTAPRRAPPQTRPLVTGLMAAAAGIIAALAAGTSPAAGQAGDGPDLYLPAAANRGQFHAPGPMPTATNTRVPVYTATSGPSPTRTPEPSATPTTQPTPPGGYVGYPKEAGTIVLQIGYTETDQPGEVWEEMNGTPWFTLYGDGTVIAGHDLPDRAQPLFTTQVDEEQIEVWLRELSFGINFYNFPDDPAALEHPGSLGKPVMHFYMNTTGGRGRRVEIRGYRHWERRPVQGHPYAAAITRLMAFARTLEAWNGDNLTAEYEPEDYTLIVQHQNPKLLPEAPPWPSIGLRAIAAAAPTAASNYVDRVPAHKFVGKTFGEDLRAIVVPEADTTWGIYNQAAEFDQGGRHYAVGIRKELPGE
ncbi:MAG: hypothetical protein ACE5EL_07085, partial [Anaerolineae bacterium]